jgi:hypothetical protein
MLQCYVLTCGRSVTTFLAPPRSQRTGQGPRLPHPKAGPALDPGPTEKFQDMDPSHHLFFYPLSPVYDQAAVILNLQI